MTVDRTDETTGQVRRGRPRSEESRASVLRSTSDLLHEVGLRAMTTDQIATRSGASKATIYKWWPNKYAVAVDAFLTEIVAESPDPDTGSADHDFAVMLRGLFHFYAGPSGRVFAQLIGEAQFDPGVAEQFRDGIIRSRRDMFAAVWDRGVARGELRGDIDRQVAIDLIVGPALYRLMVDHAPLTDSEADAVVATAMRGLAV
jgi:AcrR family transcriptional regulator